MALYTKDSIERVKEAVDMVALVGARSDLRRVGSRWTGLCPFHDERTPSLSVDGEKKLYHCFGCGESGDAIEYVEKTEGLDFREAVEMLAERYNVELKREQEDPEDEERRRRRDRLLALVERATAYYERFLWDSAEAAPAREYLAARQLGDEVLREFRVGYAPSAWDRVLVAAQRDGFSPEELQAAGLAQRGRQGGVYDRFRARVMFPLSDPRGHVLGFGARAVREEQRPKYLNTSENDIYHKGRQLFGIDRARGSAAKAGRIVAVEGYTDVLALHQAGITETVAIMGTALTQDQLAELGRAAGTIYMALDADRAGQEAMLRAAGMARERGLELLVVDMPKGSDPADLVASDGADAFRRLLDGALSVSEFGARRVLDNADLSTPRGRDRALEEVRPLVAAVPPRTASRDELIRLVSDRLDVPSDYITTQMAAPPQRRTPAPPRFASEPVEAAAPAPRPTGPPALDAIARAERTFLTMCVARADVGRDFVLRLQPEHFSFGALAEVRNHLAEHWDDPLASLPEDDPTAAALIKDVVMRADDEDVSAEVLRLSYLQLELRRMDRALRRAERTADFEEQRTLAPARQGIREQIDELMGQTQ
jgi:DNA primase